MSEPTLLQRVMDRCATAVLGGVRVRILVAGDVPQGVVIGRIEGPTPRRLLDTVCGIRPPGAGVVHLWRENGRWIVRGKGALDDPRFEQRLRNMLGNM